MWVLIKDRMQRLKPPSWSKKPALVLGTGGGIIAAALPLMAFIQGTWQPTAFQSSLALATPQPASSAFPRLASNQSRCIEPSVSQPVQADTISPGPVSSAASLKNLRQAFNFEVLNQFAWVPWPALHDRSRLARVPILMYHDVIETPEVFFDLTPQQFEEQLQKMLSSGLTPVSLDQVVQHLRSGVPLPDKPIVLTFDDGYAGHYEWVYPLLKRYQVPAVFSVFPGKLDGTIVGRSTLTWDQLRTMAADPLITIASHSVTHPPDLRTLSDADLAQEVQDSKARLETMLGIPIRYFTYPAGHYDQRVAAAVAEAGYLAALTMRETEETFAGNSASLLEIERFGQSNLDQLLDQAWGGPPAPVAGPSSFDFTAPVEMHDVVLEEVLMLMVSGGHPVTLHADSRYQVADIIKNTNAIAAVDGGFFSLEYLDSNVMIGPVLSQNTRQFVPGNPSENPRLQGRPLVLISPQSVSFIPFNAARHNTLSGIQAEVPDVTDAFVAAAWLVKDGLPQPATSFGTLFDFDASRHRAFWGINYDGQPVIGVTRDPVDSVQLGRLLAQMGLRDAVMLDSGASTSLVYQDQPLMHYEPRPVPHVVALIPPDQAHGACPLVVNTP